MKDLRELMLTGRKVVLRNGLEFLVIRDIKYFDLVHKTEEWALVNRTGFITGNEYNEELEDKDEDRQWDIEAIYQRSEDNQSQLNCKILDLDSKQHLVWKREWRPTRYEVYYTVDFTNTDLCLKGIYVEGTADLLLKERGLMFKTKEEALAKAKEMLKI